MLKHAPGIGMELTQKNYMESKSNFAQNVQQKVCRSEKKKFRTPPAPNRVTTSGSFVTEIWQFLDSLYVHPPKVTYYFHRP